MSTLFVNIQSLLQTRPEPPPYVAGADMQRLPTLENAYLLAEHGRIVAFGAMRDCPDPAAHEVIDATGRLVLPAWCDSHTHLVYAGDRSEEFRDRIRGLTYAEIAARGGGILHSARRTEAATEASLYAQAAERLRVVMAQGTGAVEIKSGYGLSPAAELKLLRVIARLRREFSIPIRATFLAAHALPAAFRNDKATFLRGMLDLLPTIAAEGLADYIDVFCETGYFDRVDTERILAAGRQYGLLGKIHVNQFTAIGGVAAAVRHGARSVDHLEILETADLEVLRGSTTMPVALPGCSFFLGLPYTPGRRLLDAGLPLALASDYNPGSAPSGNMNFVVATACIKMRLSPEEAINAATLNGAYAMGLEREVGSITVGKRANLILTKPVPSYTFLPYSFGADLVERVFV